MAMSADVVIAETEEVVAAGSIDPENVHTPAILVDYIFTK
jgi:acetate CoA/acetoacetate CoA-transferase alpha subunit